MDFITTLSEGRGIEHITTLREDRDKRSNQIRSWRQAG